MFSASRRRALASSRSRAPSSILTTRSKRFRLSRRCRTKRWMQAAARCSFSSRLGCHVRRHACSTAAAQYST
eukprot:COSAG04_NODE_5557_length_1571_cov_1.089674_1_plen_71_part_10